MNSIKKQSLWNWGSSSRDVDKKERPSDAKVQRTGNNIPEGAIHLPWLSSTEIYIFDWWRCPVESRGWGHGGMWAVSISFSEPSIMPLRKSYISPVSENMYTISGTVLKLTITIVIFSSHVGGVIASTITESFNNTTQAPSYVLSHTFTKLGLTFAEDIMNRLLPI